MKQVLAKQGGIVVADVPAPTVEPGGIVVAVQASLISTGTEMTAVQGQGGGAGSLPVKLIKNPQLIAAGLKALKQYGFKKTYQAATGTGDLGSALGYSAAGVITAVGSEITDLKIGDRVACAGAGIANHAEYIHVPRNLAVKIPRDLDFPQAASVTLGAIALQGVRQADPKVGDIVAVSGLGLLGLITVQLLRANGCQVIGIDPSQARRTKAQDYGAIAVFAPDANDLPTGIASLTDGRGVDSTIITAATSSDGPINQAMELTRAKGTVVIVGAIGLNLKRSPMYEKEIDLKISRSYGPGRYDELYEQHGLDYPYAYVRWTENRNMQAYLQLLADKKIDFSSMLEASFPIHEAPKAYASLQTDGPKPLAITLAYPPVTENATPPTQLGIVSSTNIAGTIKVAVIGAGNFAVGMHLPNLLKLTDLFQIEAIADRDGLQAKKIATQFKAKTATTHYQDVLSGPADLVMITTRHHLHVPMAIEALQAGKHVFVEKPMAMNQRELDQLTTAIQDSGKLYIVGFNRRFSPLNLRIAEAVKDRKNPMMMYYRMNAGYLPPNHWTHGPEGGGRIIGEGCHIFDVFAAWTNAKPRHVSVNAITPTNQAFQSQDNVTVTVTYQDGSVGTLLYTALGNSQWPKEYAEVYVDGKVFVMDDYRILSVHGSEGNQRLSQPDKGHFRELQVLAEALKDSNRPWPISLESMVDTTKLTFTVQSMMSKQG